MNGISMKTISQWVEMYNDGLAPEGWSLEDWLEDCETEYHRTMEIESYFYEPDPVQSYWDGYMESHQREW